MALMIPMVTVWLSWNGLPMATTYSPTAARAESPQGRAGRPRPSTLTTAMSVTGSVPTSRAAEAPAVGGGDRDLAGVLDHVVVGDDEAVRAHDHAGAEARLALLLRHAQARQVLAEELAEERIAEEGGALGAEDLEGRDVDDRGRALARDAAEVGTAQARERPPRPAPRAAAGAARARGRVQVPGQPGPDGDADGERGRHRHEPGAGAPSRLRPLRTAASRAARPEPAAAPAAGGRRRSAPSPGRGRLRR